MTEVSQHNYSRPYEKKLPQDKRRRRVKLILGFIFIAYIAIIILSIVFS